MAVLAHGCLIKQGNGATPEVFQAVSGPLSVEFTPPQPERVDVTNHDSLAREYLQGLSGEGECSFDVQYDTTVITHKSLRDLHGVEAPTNFTVTFKDGTIAAFAATVAVTFKMDIASAPQIMSVSMMISGAVTYTDP